MKKCQRWEEVEDERSEVEVMMNTSSCRGNRRTLKLVSAAGRFKLVPAGLSRMCGDLM